jgi:hypothetical protein
MRMTLTRMTLNTLARTLAPAIAALALCGACLAQGGPPMVTDDPETPGDQHWEINFGLTGARSDSRWLLAVPDVDLNYGVGEHLQLKLDMPWAIGTGGSLPRESGPGTSLAGVKWRFLDGAEDGHGLDAWSVSAYPQVIFSPSNASVNKGIAAPGHTVFLPLQASRHLGEFAIDVEAGRMLSSVDPNAWVAGALLAHACGKEHECVLEWRSEHLSGGGGPTLLNFGHRWALTPSTTLLTAAGREIGPGGSTRVSPLLYVGLQWRNP